MTSIQEKIIKPKPGLPELAKQLGSVSQACNVRQTRGGSVWVRMIADMSARNLGPASQTSHLRTCKRFAAWLRRTPDDVKDFQQHLIESGTSICIHNQTMTGIKFYLERVIFLLNQVGSLLVRFVIQGVCWIWRPASMVKPYSNDLRKRAVEAVVGGKTTRTVASRFGVAVSSVVKWHQRYRSSGTVAPDKMGGHRKIILQPHRDFVIDRINQTMTDSRVDNCRNVNQ